MVEYVKDGENELQRVFIYKHTDNLVTHSQPATIIKLKREQKVEDIKFSTTAYKVSWTLFTLQLQT